MSGCPSLDGGAGVDGLAQALRAIDCRTGDATAYAFGRLFGANGQLLPVLTALLTLYVAFFAISLLTGRTRIGVAGLTPRMLTIGLAITFATSWAAYQSVVWSLASGGPDQIAGVLAGTHGSATVAFADRLDQLFAAVADAADKASIPGPPTETGITPATPTVGGFTASTALWLCAILLMLGTAGVLLTAKIALAALLALGPVFIVFALFDATRGLFMGWVKATAMFALVPLLTVLVGGGALAALAPIVDLIAAAGGQPVSRDVAVLFLGTCVYLALMLMVLKAAGTIISGWQLPSHAPSRSMRGAVTPAPTIGSSAATTGSAAYTEPRADDRIRGIVAAIRPSAETNPAAFAGVERGSLGRARTVAAALAPAESMRVPALADRRARGIGERFRPAAARRPTTVTTRGRIT